MSTVPTQVQSSAKNQDKLLQSYRGHRDPTPPVWINPDTRGDSMVYRYIEEFKTSEKILQAEQAKRHKVLQRGEVPWMDNPNSDWIPEILINNGTLVGVEEDAEICYAPQDYHSHNAAGATTMDAAIVRELSRKFFYKKTREISVGLNVIYKENSSQLEMGWLQPNDLTFEYPLPLDSGIPNVQTLTYWGYGMGLKLGGMSMYITDASMAANAIGQFRSDFTKKQAEAVALSIDMTIALPINPRSIKCSTISSATFSKRSSRVTI